MIFKGLVQKLSFVQNSKFTTKYLVIESIETQVSNDYYLLTLNLLSFKSRLCLEGLKIAFKIEKKRKICKIEFSSRD